MGLPARGEAVTDSSSARSSAEASYDTSLRAAELVSAEGAAPGESSATAVLHYVLLGGLLLISWGFSSLGLFRLVTIASPGNGVAAVMLLELFVFLLAAARLWGLCQLRERQQRRGGAPAIRAGLIILGLVFAVLGAAYLDPYYKGMGDIVPGGSLGLALLTAGGGELFILLLFSGSPLRRGQAGMPTALELARLKGLVETLGNARTPSRRCFQDALAWVDGGCRLIVPVTGPYERSRPPHVEDLISLAYCLAEAQLITPVRIRGLSHGASLLRQTYKGTSSASPARERFTVYAIRPALMPHILAALRD